MKIWIPTRSRHLVFTQAGRTLAQLIKVPELVDKVVVVCPLEQFASYANRMPSGVRLSSCPVSGITNVRQWIGQVAKDEGDEHFCMMDDDLGFLIRKDHPDWHLFGQEPQQTLDMVNYIETLLKQGYGAVGVSAREGQNRLEDCPTDNTRLIRVLAFNTEAFLGCEHGRVEVMEDFDILLQLLRKGLPNCVTVRYAQGQRQTQEAGGCSDYRSHAVHEAAAEKLAELHAPYVRTREKKNKSGGEFGTRKEVTIAWKRAYGSSLNDA